MTASPEVSKMKAAAYAAPCMGGYFFYIPMWSILPGIYARYFGLELTAIAAVVLFIRLFDGVIDLAIGYGSDWHRSRGGSRKPWVVVGGLGTIAACYFLFQPPLPATPTYYLVCSMVYFLAFMTAEIPHLTWGGELTLDYHRRAKIFGVRYMIGRVGIIAFYALPLLPIYATSAYTPEILHDAVFIGTAMTLVGLGWMLMVAPAGIVVPITRGDDWRRLRDSLIGNKPLLLYFGGYGCLALAGGMWYGLIFLYLDSYLWLGEKVALMFFAATIIATLSTPAWLAMIRRSSKSTVWAVGVVLFIAQMIGAWLLAPGVPWWLAFLLVVSTNFFFTCNDIAAMSMLGDIVDYGKWKFRQDRGGAYFGIKALVFKVGLGIGGGMALGTAGLFGFDPKLAAHHSAGSVMGLKLAFVGMPLVCALFGLVFILRTPLTPRRHRVIQRRLESRLAMSGLSGLATAKTSIPGPG
jgi:GPH family glycoside/pentoside/hexuronide:cation symporter